MRCISFIRLFPLTGHFLKDRTEANNPVSLYLPNSSALTTVHIFYIHSAGTKLHKISATWNTATFISWGQTKLSHSLWELIADISRAPFFLWEAEFWTATLNNRCWFCKWLLGRASGRESCKGLSQEGRGKWREKILLGLKEEEEGSLRVYSLLSSNVIGLFPCHISMAKYSHKSPPLQTFHRGGWSISAPKWWEISKPHLITELLHFNFPLIRRFFGITGPKFVVSRVPVFLSYDLVQLQVRPPCIIVS